MAVSNEYYDLLHAYALGCLDKPELIKLKDYLKNGNDFAWEELGEYQNLIALLPSILSTEIPNPQLKDRVARKLYKIREESAAKKIIPPNNFIQKTRDENIKHVVQDEIKVETVGKETYQPEKMENLENEQTLENHFPEANEFQVVTSKKKIFETIRPSYDTQIRLRVTDEEKEKEPENQEDPEINDEEIVNDTFELPKNKDNDKFYKTHPKEPLKGKNKPYSSNKNTEEEPKKNNNKNLIIIIALFIIVFAGIIFMYFKISSDVKGYKLGVEKLNRQINDLSSQVNTNQDLQKLLVTKDVKIINLNGTKLAQGGYGKLIMSVEENKGYLQLFDMPQLADGKSYELWASISGKLLALGVFNSQKSVEYFLFTVPQISDNVKANYYLTETPSSDSQKPFGNIYLTSSLQ